MKTKFVELPLNQRAFVLKNYECHFDDILTNQCLTWVLNPTEMLKTDAWTVALIHFMGQQLDRDNLELTEKFEWLREVQISIMEDAKDKEGYELANNFERFIWFCEMFVAQQKSKPIPFDNSKKAPIKLNPDFSDLGI